MSLSVIRFLNCDGSACNKTFGKQRDWKSGWDLRQESKQKDWRTNGSYDYCPVCWRKRREEMNLNPFKEKKSMMFTKEDILEKLKFFCPKCNGSTYGSREKDGELKHLCHGVNCSFTWQDIDDDKYFYMKAEDVIKIVTDITNENKN